MKFVPSKPGIVLGEKETAFLFVINGFNRPEIVFTKNFRRWRGEWMPLSCTVYRHQDGDLMVDYDKRGWTPQEMKQILEFAECIKPDNWQYKKADWVDAAAKEPV